VNFGGDGELLALSATELLRRFRSRKLSPLEVFAATSRRIEALDPQLNVFLMRYLDEAEHAARASEARWVQRQPQGPLDGVPATIKDHLVAKGWIHRSGTTTSRSDDVGTFDSPSVARLKEAGAVLLGKTTMTEFGWKGTSDSPLTGYTRNPWDLTKTTGGSSSGAGAAVAAGIGALALGTDGGGSVRIPSSLCGIFGMKPSGGRAPYWPFSNNHTLTHVGPMTRSVEDGALLLSVMTKPDIRDWYALPPDGKDYTDGLKELPEGLIFNCATSPDGREIDPEVLKCFEGAVEAVQRDGQNVSPLDLHLDGARWTFETLYSNGLATTARNLTNEQFEGLEPALKRHITRGCARSALEYTQALEARVLLGHRMKVLFGDNRILLTPTTAVPAFNLGAVVPPGMSDDDPHEWHNFCYPFNLTLQPAATIPIGATASGLPIGLQIVGPIHGDHLVLQAAAYIEALLARPVRLPML
jgi:aspartyl-tRNA(Asn)/glutamyl-tRNA(Gln) amidotransferase subunit A